MERFHDYLLFDYTKKVPLDRDRIAGMYKQLGLKKGLQRDSVVLMYEFFECLVANMVDAILADRHLAFCLYDGIVPPKLKKLVIDSLSELGMIDKVWKGYYAKGHDSATYPFPMKDYSRILANVKVLNLVDRAKMKPSGCGSFIRIGNKDSAIRNDPDKPVLVEGAKLAIRKCSIPINSFRRIYSGNEYSGGRVYAPYQQMPKIKRDALLIDSENVLEIDYNANHLNMVLFLADIERNGDPYELDGFGREDVKRGINVILNSAKPIKVFTDMRKGGPFKWNHAKANQFIDKVNDKFPDLISYVNKDIGLFLQKLEGDVAIELMRWGNSRGECVLPVHDSYIVRQSIATELTNEMSEAWLRVMTNAKKDLDSLRHI